MPLRPCLGLPDQPPCTRLTPATRCPDHARAVEAGHTQAKRARRPYAKAELTRRAAAVSAWRAGYGDVCPGWQREPHASTDLTADHRVAVANGGAEDGPLDVLCRSCNSRKGSGRGRGLRITPNRT